MLGLPQQQFPIVSRNLFTFNVILQAKVVGSISGGFGD
jgi:hypothetical protein